MNDDDDSNINDVDIDHELLESISSFVSLYFQSNVKILDIITMGINENKQTTNIKENNKIFETNTYINMKYVRLYHLY